MTRAGDPARSQPKSPSVSTSAALDEAAVAGRVLGLDRELHVPVVVGDRLQQLAQRQHLADLGVALGRLVVELGPRALPRREVELVQLGEVHRRHEPGRRRRTPQVAVVDAHEVAVGGQPDVALERVRALVERLHVGGEGVLGVRRGCCRGARRPAGGSGHLCRCAGGRGGCAAYDAWGEHDTSGDVCPAGPSYGVWSRPAAPEGAEIAGFGAIVGRMRPRRGKAWLTCDCGAVRACGDTPGAALNRESSMSKATPSRRNVVRSAAWTVPIVAVTAGAPAYAASCGTATYAVAARLEQRRHDGCVRHVVPRTDDRLRHPDRGRDHHRPDRDHAGQGDLQRARCWAPCRATATTSSLQHADSCLPTNVGGLNQGARLNISHQSPDPHRSGATARTSRISVRPSGHRPDLHDHRHRPPERRLERPRRADRQPYVRGAQLSTATAPTGSRRLLHQRTRGVPTTTATQATTRRRWQRRRHLRRHRSRRTPRSSCRSGTTRGNGQPARCSSATSPSPRSAADHSRPRPACPHDTPDERCVRHVGKPHGMSHAPLPSVRPPSTPGAC